MSRLTRLEEEVVNAPPPLRVGLNGSVFGFTWKMELLIRRHLNVINEEL